MDKSKPNDYGMQLLDLCKSANLIILNGRVGSDKGVGEYTRMETTGNSVVDYVITTTNAYSLIDNFKIHSKLPDSDHRPIEFSLKCNSDMRKNGVNIQDQQCEANGVWVDQYKYVWNYQALSTLGRALNDEMSEYFHARYIDDIVNYSSPNNVARCFEEYLIQACQRVFKMQRVKPHRSMGPVWFDSDCKRARYDAVQAGGRGAQEALDKCKYYRTLKQKKKRLFKQSCIDKIEQIYVSNRSDIWATISSFAPKTEPLNIPSGAEFWNHYEKLAQPEKLSEFDYEYESLVKSSLRAYDKNISNNRNGDEKNNILNMNFSVDEIKEAVRTLKNNKSVGMECIPAEFIKACIGSFIQDICDVLNYCIEWRQFPDSWAEGLRTSVYKTGDKLNPDNYRGITVLPIFEKIFEIVVQKRLEFINEAFDGTDKYNGGFLKSSRTSDNIYILQSLIEWQVNLGQSLIVCFVDFSKAFDLINRDILFYKIIKSGLHGRVIDTLRDLYKKTAFRIKHNGRLSPPILQTVGVNQGGNASPSIFREYMSDLRDYLDEYTGVCLSDITISDTKLLNLLWADDLIMVSTTPSGAQKQLNGLEAFSRKKQTTVNNLKTKVVIFGKQMDFKLTYKQNVIEQVDHYKYLGNIIRSIQRPHGDIFVNNYEYLCDKERKAIFGLLRRLRNVGPLPPQTMIYLFECCVQPILTYGSDVWGANNAGRDAVDKILLWFLRLVLHVKSSTSNVITLGKFGKIPPGVSCEINCILYFLRLRSLSESTITNIMFQEQRRLHELGFKTWYGKVWELAHMHGIDLNHNYTKCEIKNAVNESFKRKWAYMLADVSSNPLLRTYITLKSEFKIEPFLYKIKKPKYRVAFAKLRASSHSLEIERGRHSKPKTPINSRVCHFCKIIEDEPHFLITCPAYHDERQILMSHVSSLYPRVLEMNEHEAFIFLLTNEDANISSWTRKFIHNAFIKRGLLQANTTGSIVAIPPAVAWSHETQSTFFITRSVASA